MSFAGWIQLLGKHKKASFAERPFYTLGGAIPHLVLSNNRRQGIASGLPFLIITHNALLTGYINKL